jgi:peptidyl-dipeptidase A
MADETEASHFLDSLEKEMEAVFVLYTDRRWILYTTGKEPKDYKELEKKKSDIFLNKDYFRKLTNFHDSGFSGTTGRRIDLLYREFLLQNIKSKPKVEDIKNSLEKIHSNFRATYKGKTVSNNFLREEVLKFEENREARREAFHALSAVGTKMQDKLTELVKARNEAAREMEYKDYHEVSIKTEEYDTKLLSEVLDNLDKVSKKPYESYLESVKNRLGFDDIQRWDLNFAYRDHHAKIRPYFPAAKLFPRIKATLLELGYDIEKMKITYDLEEREGKNPHAYCFTIKTPDDVRVLMNQYDGYAQAETGLHENGHAVHHKLVRQPYYTLRENTDAVFAEGMGMLFEEFMKEPKWLKKYAGMPEDLIAERKEMNKWNDLHFVRSYLTFVEFERRMYENPDQDLNSLYWDLSEKNVLLPSEKEVVLYPGIIHFTAVPVYLQNYVLARLIAAHTVHYLKEQFGDIVDNLEVGKWITDNYFSIGAAKPWPQIIKDSTGENLNPKYFIEELSK